MKRTTMLAIVLGLCVAPMAAQAGDDLVAGLSSASVGGLLGGTVDYDWWYGCTPTSAGMAMGYYDLNGYSGLSYFDLVAGGTAETSTFSSTAGTWEYLAQYAIASPGHVADYYVNSSFGASGDDVATSHSYDCLADFMGTSQDSVGNANGSTNLWYYTDGSRTYYDDLYDAGAYYYESDGMYGIGEYITYCGYTFTSLYDALREDTFLSLYTQLTDNMGADYGFTLEDYQAEIDAGRVVLIHVEGHTMIGVGYDGRTIYLYDTWSEGLDSMVWGGSYSGLSLWGVTVFELAGGDAIASVPVPGAIVLVAMGAGCMRWLRRRRTF